MADNREKIGGYNIQFVKSLDSRYKCPICTLALRSPFQTECGHRFCESCIKENITNGPKACPVDNSPLTIGQIFKDAFCNREILELECYCTSKSLGCKWTGPLRGLQEHYGECLYFEMKCPNNGCEVNMQRRLLEKHMKGDCVFKKIPCPYCNTEVPHQMMKKHHDEECTKIQLPCPNRCGIRIAREDIEQHVGQECPNTEASCPYIFGACAFQGSRADLKKHLTETSVNHAFIVHDQVVTFKSEIEDLQTKIANLVQQTRQIETKLANQNEAIVSLRDDVATLRPMLDNHERRIKEVAQTARASAPEGGRDRGAQKPPDPTEINELKRNVKKIEEQVNKLHSRERQALGRVQTGAQTPAAGQAGGGEDSAALERRMSRMEHQQTLSDVQMAEHDVKITMLETTAYDGEFIWKIDDLGRRIHEAVTGKTLSIYSPPFFVGRFGYKVCARVYLNGDGMGKGTHLSLFFVVMRGSYDALLPWPFQQKVSFKLIDQSGDQHITDSFRPDPNSSSFQRPTSNMNIASGCPLFVPKSVLHSRGYIKDETIFCKITVDTTGIPNF